MPKLKHKKVVLGLTAIFATTILAAGAAWLQYGRHAVIPNKIKSQLNFVPYANSENKIASQPRDLKYDNKVKALNYVVQISGTRAVVSQQAMPQNFAENSAAYNKLLSSISSHKSFDTNAGKVHINEPLKANVPQTAVLNNGKVLLFVNADKSLSVDIWKQFFNDLDSTR